MNRESFVDWLVHWVPSGDQPRFKEALERELRRWFLCDEAFDVTCTCKMAGCSLGCMKTQRDLALARAERAEAIVARFSTWIDNTCGPIMFERTVKKLDLIESWDRARDPEFFAKHDAAKPGGSVRCDDCDWTFGCFNGSAPCRKQPAPERSVPAGAVLHHADDARAPSPVIGDDSPLRRHGAPVKKESP